MAATDESPIGIWLWLVILAVNGAMIVGFDVWLNRHGHEMLTTEFREGLANTWWGPLLAFLVAGTVAAFVWHMTRSPGH